MKDVQDTSRAAFDDALPRRPQTEAAILACLRIWGPRTCTELADDTGIVIDTVRPAVTHLRKLGFVEKTDIRRPTRYGKASIAWRATL